MSVGCKQLFSFCQFHPSDNFRCNVLEITFSTTQDPAAGYVEEFSAVIADGRLELQVELPVSPTACIAPGSLFTISITGASLQGLEGLCSIPGFSPAKTCLLKSKD